jgi:hypothetical protein
VPDGAMIAELLIGEKFKLIRHYAIGVTLRLVFKEGISRKQAYRFIATDIYPFLVVIKKLWFNYIIIFLSLKVLIGLLFSI